MGKLGMLREFYREGNEIKVNDVALKLLESGNLTDKEREEIMRLAPVGALKYLEKHPVIQKYKKLRQKVKEQAMDKLGYNEKEAEKFVENLRRRKR